MLTSTNVSLMPIINPLIMLMAFDSSVIEHATLAGLNEIGTELAKMVAMSAEKGMRYYNANRERISK